MAQKKTNAATAETPVQAVAEPAEKKDAAAAETAVETRRRERISIKNAGRLNTTREDEARRSVEEDSYLEGIRNDIFRKTIKLSEVSSVVTKKLGDKEVVFLKLTPDVAPENIRILIPYNKVFQTSPIPAEELENLDGNELVYRQKQALTGLIMSSIRWIPESIVEDETGYKTDIIGSRAAAMEIDRRSYFTGKDAVVKENHTYYGRVMSVSDRGSALIYYGGVEKVIAFRFLSNRYSRDIYGLLTPGDKIPLTVRNIKIDPATNEVNCEFDCLSGELVEAQPRIRALSKNEITAGVISKSFRFTSEEGDHRLRYIAWLNGNIPAKVTSFPTSRNGVLFKRGDKIQVRITGRDEDGYATCTILKLLSANGF